MTALRLAWRNIWRNSRRSAITLAALVASTAIMITMVAWTWGMMLGVVANVTDVILGEAQVHAPGWRADRSIYRTVRDPGRIVRAAERSGILACPRSYGFGLVSCGRKSGGAMFWGVDPARERAAFKLAGYVASPGSFLPDGPRRRIVLGRRLAKSLAAKPGSEIVALSQGADGSLGSELFTVVGVLDAAGEEIDRNAAIIHSADFSGLFSTGGTVHEVALTSKGALPLQAIGPALAGSYGRMEFMTWRQLVPMIADWMRMFDAVFLIFGSVFFLAAGLGVLNTMLMATHERIREFGVLKAIGARPWRIVRDVGLEAFLLGLIGTAGGILVALAACWYMEKYGIDARIFSGGSFSFSGVSFDPVMRAKLTAGMVVKSAGMLLVTCVAAALYPAVKASRLDPVKAMTHV